MLRHGNAHMNDEDRKAQIKQTFDTVAEGYGSEGMKFFCNAALHLPALFEFHGHERVLDVATGTGIAAVAMAPHLPNGKVIGIDLSEAMLEQARTRAERLGFNNVDLHAMDMQNIGFDAASFDAANCSFGIFFLPDMQSLLRHIASKVKPGCRVVASSFYQGSFEPNLTLFLTRIARYGIAPPSFNWREIATEETFEALFTSAGLNEVRVEKRDIGYYLNDAEIWWRVIWYAGFRGLVAQLSDTDLADFKRDHLAEIDALKTERGIPLNVTALFASGRAG